MTITQLSRAVLACPDMAAAISLIESETTKGDPVEIYWEIIERAEMAAEMRGDE
jgi:hypothetical protein